MRYPKGYPVSMLRIHQRAPLGRELVRIIERPRGRPRSPSETIVPPPRRRGGIDTCACSPSQRSSRGMRHAHALRRQHESRSQVWKRDRPLACLRTHSSANAHVRPWVPSPHSRVDGESSSAWKNNRGEGDPADSAHPQCTTGECSLLRVDKRMVDLVSRDVHRHGW
jgi:hypothetical protein